MSMTSKNSSIGDFLGSERAEHDALALSKDVAFQLMSNWRRREVLAYLRKHGGEATVGELAEHIASIKEEVPIAQVTSKQRKRVYVGLYQCHLDQLAEHDVIEYNKNRGIVRSLPIADQFTPYVDEESSKLTDRLHPTVVYSFIALAVMVSIAAVTLGVYTQLTVPLAIWSGLSTAGFVMVSARTFLFS